MLGLPSICDSTHTLALRTVLPALPSPLTTSPTRLTHPPHRHIHRLLHDLSGRCAGPTAHVSAFPPPRKGLSPHAHAHFTSPPPRSLDAHDRLPPWRSVASETATATQISAFVEAHAGLGLGTGVSSRLLGLTSYSRPAPSRLGYARPYLAPSRSLSGPPLCSAQNAAVKFCVRGATHGTEPTASRKPLYGVYILRQFPLPFPLFPMLIDERAVQPDPPRHTVPVLQGYSSVLAY
ncbi:hypothetical protein B0H12DRAFT_1231606 [Mycena haematopus]|nr:hypothetical protein B0H12DRAFT_1231606 [Mycena haematopus]